MFDTIVLALDGSDQAKAAIPVARDLAKADGNKIVITHVEEHFPARAVGTVPPIDEDRVQAEIRDQASELAADGIETSVEVRKVMLGGPAPAIADVADEAGAELIVVGTRGHSPVPGLLLGSVAQRLLHVAHQPVLVVPPAAS